MSYSHDITTKNLQFAPNIQTAYQRVIPESILTERDACLSDSILVQVLEIFDVSKSAYKRLEILEENDESNIDRMRRRTVGLETGDSQGFTTTCMHKLVLQDSAGTLIYGIEYRRIAQLSERTELGCKFLLRKTKFHRGVALLEPETVTVLGGSIPEMNVSRTEIYKQKLKQQLDQVRPQGGQNF